jgi:hypothetical protein
LTLAKKYKKPMSWVYKVFGNDIVVSNGKKENRLRSRISILNHRNKFNLNANFYSLDHIDVDNMIGRFNRLIYGIEFFGGCSVTNCSEFENIQVYRTRRLHHKVSNNGLISVVGRKGAQVSGLVAILTMINRKQIPLCGEHFIKFESGIFSPLDYSKLNRILWNIPKPKNKNFKPIFDGENYVIDNKKSDV